MGYYGKLVGEKPVRSLADDIIKEDQQNMQQQLREMQEKLFRHLNEIKREIIREFHEVKTKREELQIERKIKQSIKNNVDTAKE